METKTTIIMNLLFYGMLFLIPLTMMSFPEIWVEFSHLFASKKPTGKDLTRAMRGYKLSGVVILAVILTLLYLRIPGFSPNLT